MRNIPKDRLVRSYRVRKIASCNDLLEWPAGQPHGHVIGGNMQIELNSSTLNLSPAGVIAVQDGTGTQVLCLSGVLWVTEEGESKDSIVRAGDVLTLRKPGRTVISALEAASLTLMGPEPYKLNGSRQRDVHRL